MARQTRAERRARRQAQAQSQPQPAEPAIAGAGAGNGEQAAKAERRPREESKGGIFNFFAESWGELKKVEWPSQNHVIQGTIVVFVACIILGTFIWLCDIAFKHLVQDVLLR